MGKKESKMKYKIGDKVRVREDLEVGKFYNKCYFNSLMAKLKGKVVEIKGVDSESYSIKEDTYYWTDEMFSGLAEEPRNLIPLIAKELGVEIGEEFKVDFEKKDRHYWAEFTFLNDGLFFLQGNCLDTKEVLFDLITGVYGIQKLPKKPKLTEDEKVILRNLPKEYRWIARDNSRELYIYENKPKKDGKIWWIYGLKNQPPFQHLFQFIKWEDKEPYKIKELLEE
jgi:hypothetical protein